MTTIQNTKDTHSLLPTTNRSSSNNKGRKNILNCCVCSMYILVCMYDNELKTSEGKHRRQASATKQPPHYKIWISNPKPSGGRELRTNSLCVMPTFQLPLTLTPKRFAEQTRAAPKPVYLPCRILSPFSFTTPIGDTRNPHRDGSRLSFPTAFQPKLELCLCHTHHTCKPLPVQLGDE